MTQPVNGPEDTPAKDEDPGDPQEQAKPGPRKPDADEKLTKAEWQEFFDKEVLPKRLQRKEKEVLKTLGLNSVDEYATIQEKAKNYDSEVEKNKTEDQRRAEREAERDRQLVELQRNLAERDRKLAITEIADDLGLPKKLRSFIQGDDEDSIRESAQSLLDAMSEVGGPKNTPQKKSPDDSVKEQKGTFYGGGGKKPDKTVNPDELAKNILKKQGGLLAR